MTTQRPRCPRCNRWSDTPHEGKNQWYCHNCEMAFDPEDDGDWSNFHSDARLIREERQYGGKRRERR